MSNEQQSPVRRGPNRRKKAAATPAAKPATKRRSARATEPAEEASPRGRAGERAQAEAERAQAEAAIFQATQALELVIEMVDRWGLDEAMGSIHEGLSWVREGQKEIARLPEDWAPPVGGAPLGENSLVELFGATQHRFRRALGEDPKATVVEDFGDGQYLLRTDANGIEIVVPRNGFRVLRRERPVVVEVEAVLEVPADYGQPGTQLDVEIEAKRRAAEAEAETADHANGVHTAA